MKSVKITDSRGGLLLKVLHRKNGEVEIIKAKSLAHLKIEVRDDRNLKIMFEEEVK